MREPDHRTYYHRSGKIHYKVWQDEGKNRNHNEDGPAVIEYSPAGPIVAELWWLNGKRHREDGPAVIRYNHNGEIAEYCEWYKHNKIHNENGPALVIRDNGNNIVESQWWIDSEPFDIDDLAKYIALPDEDKVALKLIT